MNPETGELRDLLELIEEHGDMEGVREAGFVEVPRHLERPARQLIEWAAAERKNTRRRKRRRHMRQTSRRRNRR